MEGRRVAITGVGVVAPCGIGRDAFWEGLLRPAADGVRRVEGFDPSFWFNPKEARRIDRFAQFAAAAAAEALADAGSAAPLTADPDRSGVLIATGVGGLATLEEQVVVHHESGPRRVSPFLVPMMMANAGAAAVSMRFGFRGPCETITTACAAGTHAIGNAARLIAMGRCDAVLAGGSEAPLTPTAMQAFSNMTALSATQHSAPFSAERDGFVMSEGGAVLMLEPLDAALARGAHVYAEVLGAASTADAHHITAPAPGGAGAVACIEQVIADAGISAADIGHVNAHGTSTPLNDAAEAEAIGKVLGIPSPPVTSIKGVTGHGLGAAGAIEAVALALTIDRAIIPPTAGTTAVDPALPIDLVIGEPRPWSPAPALSNSFGFGGHNGCLILAPVA